MMRDSEPVAHCYRCAKAISGECVEFNTLNPQYEGGYDRKGCPWGSKYQLRMILFDANDKKVFDSAIVESVSSGAGGRVDE